MPPKGKGKNKDEQKPDRVAFQGFVNYTLPDDERARFDIWWEDAGDKGIWEHVGERLLTGYKITLSRDEYHDCFQASLTCNNPDHPDAGWCLQARSDTYEEALATLIYKDAVLLGEGWLVSVKTSKKPSKWG